MTCRLGDARDDDKLLNPLQDSPEHVFSPATILQLFDATLSVDNASRPRPYWGASRHLLFQATAWTVFFCRAGISRCSIAYFALAAAGAGVGAPGISPFKR
jgi:hypothetical protein